MRYLLGSYRYILFAAPFLACLVAAYCCGTIPGSSAIGKALGGLAEEGLGELLKKNGFASYGLVRFQLLRFLLAVVCAAVLAIVLGGGDTKKALLLAAATFVGFYKLLYFYMLYRDRMRIAHLNAVLPYHKTEDGKLIYARTVYFCDCSFHGGFTFVTREIFRLNDLTPAGFAVYLYLCCAAGNRGRAFPSISRITEVVGAAKSTVCLVLQRLRELPEMLVRLCKKANGAFAATSYIFSQMWEGATQHKNFGKKAEHSAIVEPGGILRMALGWLKRFLGRGLSDFYQTKIRLR